MNARTRSALVALLAVFAVACGDSSSTSPEPDTPPTIMVLSDGGTEAHLTSILTDAGMTVVDGGPYKDFVGDGLENVDAVVLPAAIDWSYEMTPEGEAALVGYTLQGGGLFTIEWVVYNEWPIVSAVFPVDYGSGYDYGTEQYSVVVSDAVTEGLPATFMPGPDHSRVDFAPKPGSKTWIMGSESGPALVGWSVPGRVISWNGAAEYNGSDVWTDDLDRMVVNAIGYAAGGPLDYQPTGTSTIALEAVDLDITKDGDVSAGDGDFYFTTRLSIDVGGEPYELDSREDVLRQGSDGELLPVNVGVETTLPAFDGMEVTAEVSYYENDASGPQATAEALVVFTYDATQDCWAKASSAACVSAGEALTSTLVLQDTVGEPLDVSLAWTFGVQ